MISTERISLLALLPLLASAQECPGTTYSNLCCHGSIVGSSVALPPATTFPLGTPPSYTASNNYHLSDYTHALPSGVDLSSILSNPAALSSYAAENSGLATDAAGLASLSREFDSLLSQAATDTNVFSILPISAAGLQKRASTKETIITAGVTCQGSLATLASNTASETGASTQSGASATASSASASSPAPTSAPATTSTAAASTATSDDEEATSSAAAASSAAAESSASTGAAPAPSVGVTQKLGAALGAGLGVALGFL